MKSQVRVRFAPSPTGHLHIGGARTALFNYVFAKKRSGKFILRIEDTDAARSTEESLHQILDSLEWLGLNWDEGPFLQSERGKLYRDAVETLLKSNRAYRCFCPPERLDELRDEAKRKSTDFIYDRKCAELSDQEETVRIEQGEKFVVRFRSRDDMLTLHDMILGDISFDLSLIGDFIIARSDGAPVYNLSVVVDDAEMEITHVIRGNDHVSNTPKQVMLFEALGHAIPQFAHLPLILGKDKTRLSKRHGATSVMQFQREGFLSGAMVNCLALLGWAYDDTKQIFSIEELIELFSLERVSKASAVFDYEKLSWLNGYYIRTMPKTAIIQEVLDFFPEKGYDPHKYDREWLEDIISLQIERSKTLSEMVDSLRLFLDEEIAEYDPKGAKKFLSAQNIDEIFPDVISLFESLEDFSLEDLDKELRALADRKGIKFGKMIHPIRVALTGRTASPGIFDVIHLLGREKSVTRLKKARELFRVIQ